MFEENFSDLIPADPKFSAPILNVTVPVSRDAILTCRVHDLIQYKVRKPYDLSAERKGNLNLICANNRAQSCRKSIFLLTLCFP